MVAFVVVPQWQGSGSSRAMQLADGAEAIRGDLPSSRTRTVEVPVEAGENQETGVDRITSLCAIRDSLAAILAETDDAVITIGGDCGVELAAVSDAVRRWGSRLALVWFDAHPDLHTPQSSPSHAFHGMVLRTLLGEGQERLVPDVPGRVNASQVLLAGTRSWDDAEVAYADAAGITSLGPAELEDPDVLVAALEASDVAAVYVHVDLDVLDPGSIAGVGFPEPFGLSPATLLSHIRALRERYPLAGAAITEFAPATAASAEDDLPTILRIVGALTSGAA